MTGSPELGLLYIVYVGEGDGEEGTGEGRGP
jgi:hypothetical protein